MDREPMMRWIFAYVTAGIAFGILDALWLGWAAPNLYRPIIGEIMAEDVNLTAAAAFYLIYLAGMLWFAVRPALAAGSIRIATLNGALLGGLCYATFDLTSQAIFSVWETYITVADIVWGSFATAAASTIASWVTLKFKS